MFNDHKCSQQSPWTHTPFGVQQTIDTDYFIISTWGKGFETPLPLTSGALLTARTPELITGKRADGPVCAEVTLSQGLQAAGEG